MKIRAGGASVLRSILAITLTFTMVVGAVPAESFAEALEEASTTQAQVTPTQADLAKSLVEQVRSDAVEGATSKDLARAYAAAANAAGLACVVVSTEAGAYWNRVSVDDSWYHVDLSTDDVILLDDEALASAYPDRSTWVEDNGAESEELPEEGTQDEGGSASEDESEDESEEQSAEEEVPSEEGAEESTEVTDTQDSDQGDVEGQTTDAQSTSEATASTKDKNATEEPDLAPQKVIPEITTEMIADIADQTYTGSQIKPEVTVTYEDTKLVLDEDYTLTYSNNVKVGTATVTVKGVESHSTGTATKTFEIVPASISGAKIVLEKTSFVYTGSQIKPKVKSVTLGKTKLSTSDYSLSYSNNTKVGSGVVTIKGKGNYTDTATTKFTISAPTSISKAKVTLSATSFAYSGSAIKPKVKSVVLNGKTLKSGTDYTVSYANNTKVGTGTVTVKGKGSYKDSAKATFKIMQPTVTYRTHCQTYGWRPWASNGATNGTTGQSKRVEAVQIKLGTGFPVSGGITYRTHVQGIGWTGWSENGNTSGLTGQSKRAEAIEIKLTGSMSSKYDVYYRVHAQNVGWTAWAKNGQRAGTTGMAWRLEAIQVKLVLKNGSAPSSSGSNTNLTVVSNPGVAYCSYVQDNNWSGWSTNGGESGTTGQGKRVEAVQVKLAGTAVPGSIDYATHVQGIGWTGWSSNGASSGAAGSSRRVEALKIQLSGEASKYFDVYYRAHVQSVGWLGWAKNGEDAGSLGASKRMEAYQVVLVPKGAAAPGSSVDHVIDAAWLRNKEEQEAIRRMQADPMFAVAQGYSSPTNWLILVDCTTCNMAIFQGSRGNWIMRDKYPVGVGANETPSRHGIFSIGNRGFAFSGWDYTCYYYLSYYNDYLFHSVIYHLNSNVIKDNRLGERVSHGCVRQSTDKAKWLYENIPYGTTVFIYDS